MKTLRFAILLSLLLSAGGTLCAQPTSPEFEAKPKHWFINLGGCDNPLPVIGFSDRSIDIQVSQSCKYELCTREGFDLANVDASAAPNNATQVSDQCIRATGTGELQTFPIQVIHSNVQ
jgi:hypothetical protein